MLLAARGANNFSVVFLHLVQKVRKSLTTVFAKNLDTLSALILFVGLGHSLILRIP